MPQRRGDRRGRHRRERAQARLLGAGMGAVGPEALVRDEVGRRHRAEAAADPGGEHPAVVPGVETVADAVEHPRPVGRGVRVAEQPLEPAAAAEPVPGLDPLVVVAPGPPPRRPAPDQRIARERVVELGRLGVEAEVVAGDRPDALVVAVAVEQLVAVVEEARVRDAVVLEHDRILGPIEDPVEAARHPPPDPEVLGGEVGLDLAVPVDAFDQRPRPRAGLAVAGMIGAGRVGEDQQPRRAGAAHRLEHPRGQIGAPEDRDRDRRPDRAGARLATDPWPRDRGRLGSRRAAEQLELVDVAGEVEEVDGAERAPGGDGGVGMVRRRGQERILDRLHRAPDRVEGGGDPMHGAGREQLPGERPHLVVEDPAAVLVGVVGAAQDRAVVGRREHHHAGLDDAVVARRQAPGPVVVGGRAVVDVSYAGRVPVRVELREVALVQLRRRARVLVDGADELGRHAGGDRRRVGADRDVGIDPDDAVVGGGERLLEHEALLPCRRALARPLGVVERLGQADHVVAVALRVGVPERRRDAAPALLVARPDRQRDQRDPIAHDNSSLIAGATAPGSVPTSSRYVGTARTAAAIAAIVAAPVPGSCSIVLGASAASAAPGAAASTLVPAWPLISGTAIAASGAASASAPGRSRARKMIAFSPSSRTGFATSAGSIASRSSVSALTLTEL